MSKTIWKYPLAITDAQPLRVHSGAVALCVQTQRGIPCVWILQDPSEPEITLVVEIFGTGHPVNSGNHSYIGSVQTDGGAFVWHVFQKTDA